MHIVHVFENFPANVLSGSGAKINEVFEKITCMTTKKHSEIIAADSSKELFSDHENLF